MIINLNKPINKNMRMIALQSIALGSLDLFHHIIQIDVGNVIPDRNLNHIIVLQMCKCTKLSTHALLRAMHQCTLLRIGSTL